jgi:hypothetical protein
MKELQTRGAHTTALRFGKLTTRRDVAGYRPQRPCVVARSHGREGLILPDVNVLIYAFRADSEDHSQYKDWLESVVNGGSAHGIAPQVLASVVRITTHPRIYAQLEKGRFRLLPNDSPATECDGDRAWPSPLDDL